MDDKEKEARYAAVLGIIGFIDLPIVKFSVEWWRTLHQPASIKPQGISLGGDIRNTLLMMSLGVTLLFVYMLMMRTQQLYLEHLLEAKKGRLLTRVHL